MTVAHLFKPKINNQFLVCRFGRLCAFDDNTITCDDNGRLIVWHGRYRRIDRELQFSVSIEHFELNAIFRAY